VFCGAGEDWAAFFGVVTNRDDAIKRVMGKLFNGLRAVVGDIDADLVHGENRFGAHETRRRASAEDVEAIAGHMTEESFGHLTAGGIAGTEDEDRFLRHGRSLAWE